MITPTCMEREILSEDQGIIALGLSLIMSAVSDIRLHLAPEPCRAITASSLAQHRISLAVRHVHALQAASFLQSSACREWVELLAACGAPVPMRRIFTELKKLKEVAQ